MSEGSASIAITQRINAGRIGAKLIVNLDVTAVIYLNPGLFQTEVVGIRPPTDCEKHMRTDDSLIAAAAIDLRGHFVAAFFKADAFSVQTDFDAFGFENFFCFFRKRLFLHAGTVAAPSAQQSRHCRNGDTSEQTPSPRSCRRLRSGAQA